MIISYREGGTNEMNKKLNELESNVEEGKVMKRKFYVPMDSFLFKNDKRFHLGRDIKEEILRVISKADGDNTKSKELQIASYMQKKFIDTVSPIRDTTGYMVNINKLIFDVPYHEFLELNLNNHVKFIKDKKTNYYCIKVTDNKYFLDFLKYLRSQGIKLSGGFALVQYTSGEKRLITSPEDFVKWIPVMNNLENLFGLLEYTEGTISAVLVSNDFAYKHEFVGMDGVEVKIYDKGKKYSY